MADPQAFIMHHTAGRGTPEGVVNWWRKQGRGYGSQYIMDRDGVVHDVAKEFGYTGSNQIKNGSGVGKGLNNGNVVGMEIIAKDDKDVTPAQAQAAAQFVNSRYPNIPLYGHGQVNPNDRQPTEGMTAINAAMKLRNPDIVAGGGSSGGAGASGTWATPAGTTTINHPNAPIAGALAGQDTRQLIFNKLTAAGLAPHQALGALYSLGGESSTGLDPASYNPNDPGGSVGIAQWRGSRRQALEAYARAQGTAVTDPNTQAGFLVDELTNPKSASYQPGVFSAMQKTQNVADATNVWTGKFERPKVNNWQARLAQGSSMGTLGANNQFVLGTGAPATGGAGPADASIAARGGVSPSLPGDTAVAADQPWWKTAAGQLTGRDPVTGQPVDQKGSKALAAVTGNQKEMQAKEAEQAPETKMGPAPLARNVGPMGGPNANPSLQTYGQTLNSLQLPLTWNDHPPPAPSWASTAGFRPAAFNTPGTSLTSFQPPSIPDPYGLGYGSVGYGFG